MAANMIQMTKMCGCRSLIIIKCLAFIKTKSRILQVNKLFGKRNLRNESSLHADVSYLLTAHRLQHPGYSGMCPKTFWGLEILWGGHFGDYAEKKGTVWGYVLGRWTFWVWFKKLLVHQFCLIRTSLSILYLSTPLATTKVEYTTRINNNY